MTPYKSSTHQNLPHGNFQPNIFIRRNLKYDSPKLIEWLWPWILIKRRRFRCRKLLIKGRISNHFPPFLFAFLLFEVTRFYCNCTGSKVVGEESICFLHFKIQVLKHEECIYSRAVQTHTLKFASSVLYIRTGR